MIHFKALLRFTPALLVLFGLACDDATMAGPEAETPGYFENSVLRGETLTQVDRMGFPAINTAVVIDNDAKDLFNQSAPAGDAGFIPFAVGQLEAIYVVPPDRGTALAGLLLPDVLTLGGPVFVGREPADDVIDAILGTLFGDGGFSDLAPFPGLASDNIGANDVPFPDTFPYLAGPHGA